MLGIENQEKQQAENIIHEPREKVIELVKQKSTHRRAVVVASSSPFSKSDIFGDPIWGDYFNGELASNSPIRREKARKRIMNAISPESDFTMIIGDPERYAHLNELIREWVRENNLAGN